MNDPVLNAFLEQQLRQGIELAANSDLLELVPDPTGVGPPSRFIARYTCKGLVKIQDGAVCQAAEFAVGIWFPSEYLRQVEPLKTLTWLGPTNAWHPNILGHAICIGRIIPGTELVDLLYQCYEIITYHNWAPHDALNPEAAQWARNNQQRFPVDRRPLKRRLLDLQIEDAS